MKPTLELLKEITELDGPSGYEAPVGRYVAEILAGTGEITRDNLGSVICRKPGAAAEPRIMIAGHMDEIGFMVKLVTKEGFVKFAPLGGWWSQVLLAQRVRILTSKGVVIGVVGSKPPHLLRDNKRGEVVDMQDMFIDVGATDKAQAEEQFGILPGDPIVPDSPFARMNDDQMLLAKAWDDRAGVAMFIETLWQLAEAGHPNTVYGVGTVQEEVGLRGAQTAADAVQPHVALIAETAIAGDMPGIEDHESPVKMGQGPVIYVLDGSMIPNLRLRDLAIATCREAELPYQTTVLERGGTDGGRIHVYARGVPSLVIGVPTRHIHSHAAIMHLRDYEQCVQLMVALCRKLDAAAVATLTAE
ncbi:MAG: M42 family metallopeptidase [Armatimonadetes bacterium]|nr:M42 family metallopeptidase [Armatimonadota bacterium]